MGYFASVFNTIYNFKSYQHWLEWKQICKMFLEHKHKGHVQSVIFCTFPRPVIEDQNRTKTIQCGQCIKVCGCPDHQLNMEMNIKYIIAKINHFTGYVIRYVIVNLIFVNMPWMRQNWACTGPITAGSISLALAWFWHIKECLQEWHYTWLLSFLAIILRKAAVPEPDQYWSDTGSICSVPLHVDNDDTILNFGAFWL